MIRFTLKRSIGILLILFFCRNLSAQYSPRYLDRPLPEGWTADSLVQQRLPIEDQWWNGFEDPMLDSLLRVAIDRNYNLWAAADRISMARANWRIAQSGYYPSVQLTAGWTKSKSSGNTSEVSLPSDELQSQYASAALSTSWEIDVFGSIRNKAKAGRKSYEASLADYNAVMVSLAAEVGTVYANLRTAQQQLEVAQKNATSQYVTLKIVEARYNSGLVSRLDLSQAQSVYYSTQATIPAIELSITQYINSMAILLGDYPQAVQSQLSVIKPLPNYRRYVSVGIPFNLLRQRPDVIASERQVEANAASLGATRADWFPKFYLNASIGYASRNMDDLFNHGSMTYEIAPSITWTVFNGLQRSQAVKLSHAQLDESIEQYNQTVLTAVQEVENAIASYRRGIEQIQLLEEVVQQGAETLQLSLELYKQGLSDFQNVLDAQRSLLTYENNLVTAQGSTLQSLIQLYKSVGGGWDASSSYNASNTK